MGTASQNFPATVTTLIANGASLSASVNASGMILCGIVMPAAWTAANITFQASADGTTFFDLYDVNAAEFTVTAAASRTLAVNYNNMGLAWPFLKVRSGTTGTPVNQGGDRIVTLQFRPIV